MSHRTWRVRFAGINRREYLAFVEHAGTGQEVRVRNRLHNTGLPKCDECGAGQCDHTRAAERAYQRSIEQEASR
jgi:hypothetical protein